MQASKLSPWGCLGSILSNTSFVTSHTLTQSCQPHPASNEHIGKFGNLAACIVQLSPSVSHSVSIESLNQMNCVDGTFAISSAKILFCHLQENILVQITICKVLLEKEIRL